MDRSRGEVLTWPMADNRPAIVQSERMMKTFIRVAEIWVPTKDRTQLQFLDGLYGPLGEFRAVSEQMRFGFDEGLPGKAWATGHPIILKKFANSYFKRTEAAKAAGLTCGVALPVFAGERPEGGASCSFAATTRPISVRSNCGTTIPISPTR